MVHRGGSSASAQKSGQPQQKALAVLRAENEGLVRREGWEQEALMLSQHGRTHGSFPLSLMKRPHRGNRRRPHPRPQIKRPRNGGAGWKCKYVKNKVGPGAWGPECTSPERLQCPSTPQACGGDAAFPRASAGPVLRPEESPKGVQPGVGLFTRCLK